MAFPPPEDPGASSDFNQIDQALVLFWLELYRSIHLHNSVAAQTATRLFQLLVGAIAALGGLAMSFVHQDTVAGTGLAGLLLLIVIPLTIAILYTIWLRETARVARNSLFLLRLEGKVSEYVSDLQSLFISTSKVGRSGAYTFMKGRFEDRFIDWEIWWRKENFSSGRYNLSDELTLGIVSVLFGVVAIISATVGLGLWRMFAFLQCAIWPERPLTLLSQLAGRSGLLTLFNPFGGALTSNLCTLGSDVQLVGTLSYIGFGIAAALITISAVQRYMRYRKIQGKIIKLYFPRHAKRRKGSRIRRFGRRIRKFGMRLAKGVSRR